MSLAWPSGLLARPARACWFHAKACAEVISKEAMSEGDVDAVTKDTGYGRVLGEIIRDWGVACAKRRAECLIKLVSKTVPNISTASGGGSSPRSKDSDSITINLLN